MSQMKERMKAAGSIRTSSLEEKCAKELSKTRTKIAQQLREDMNSLLQDGHSSDLTIRVANQEIQCHKCIIKSRLPTFWRDRLGCPDDQETVTLDLPSSEDIKLILRYIYCEEDLSLLDEVLNSMTESKLATSTENTSHPVIGQNQGDVMKCDIKSTPGDLTNCNLVNGVPFTAETDFQNNINSESLDQNKTQTDCCQTNHLPVNGEDEDSSIVLHSPVEEVKNAGVSCRLGLDLLNMYKSGAMSDLVLAVNETRFNVHRCVLSARSSYFAAMLGGGWMESRTGDVALEGVSAEAMEPILCYMYGGLIDLPPDVSLTEMVAISDMYAIAGLKDLVSFVIKRDKAHFFHKPCSECALGVVSILPLVYTYGITDVWERALRWIARNFVRVWPAKQFATLPEEVLEKCLECVIQDIGRDNVIDMVTDCDRLMGSLTNVRWSEPVVGMATRLMAGCINYLRNNMVQVMATPKFADLGITMALGLSILEDIFSQAIVTMPPEKACQTYMAVQRLSEMAEREQCIWNEDFKNLVSRLSDKCNHFMMLHINQLINTPGWMNCLSAEIQEKIKKDAWYVSVGDETFVRKLPPRLTERVPADPRKASVRPKTTSAQSRQSASKRQTTTIKDTKVKRSQGAENTVTTQSKLAQGQRSTSGSRTPLTDQGHSKKVNQESRASNQMARGEEFEGQASEGRPSNPRATMSNTVLETNEHLVQSMAGDTICSDRESSIDTEGAVALTLSSMCAVPVVSNIPVRPVPVIPGESHRIRLQQPLVWTFTAPDFLYVQQKSSPLYTK